MRQESAGRAIVAMCGLITIGIGLYFIFFRPSLLPEDQLYLGVNENIYTLIPNLSSWLQNVFAVLGGFIFSTGFLKVVLSRMPASKLLVLALVVAWLFSIALIVGVNFKIQSDFKWQLLTLAFLELTGLGLLWVSSKRYKN